MNQVSYSLFLFDKIYTMSNKSIIKLRNTLQEFLVYTTRLRYKMASVNFTGATSHAGSAGFKQLLENHKQHYWPDDTLTVQATSKKKQINREEQINILERIA